MFQPKFFVASLEIFSKQIGPKKLKKRVQKQNTLLQINNRSLLTCDRTKKEYFSPFKTASWSYVIFTGTSNSRRLQVARVYLDFRNRCFWEGNEKKIHDSGDILCAHNGAGKTVSCVVSCVRKLRSPDFKLGKVFFYD